MISYQIYKMIHIISIVLFFSVYLSAAIKTGSLKKEKIITGILLVLILASGMGLVARLGIPHASPWPTWLRVKLGIWIFIGCSSHIVLKRWHQHAVKFFYFSILLLTLASFMANYKV